MEEQIEQAVAYALSPTADQSLKNQVGSWKSKVPLAINFCDQVKVSPDGWHLCLSLFVRFPKSTPEARLFALQVLEDVMQNRFLSLNKSQVIQIQSTLMEFVKREYVIGEGGGVDLGAEPLYLKNKFAHTLTLLFIQMYPSDWHDFFDQFLELLQTNTVNGSKTNIRTVDIFLRILMSIDEEVANIVVPRGKDQAHRNTAIKDNMRAGDIQKLTSTWYEILSDYRARNPEIAEMCLKVIGLYIAWIDINLIVNDAFITLLYELLTDTKLRIAACECLSEIVYKGMKPVEKLKLIEFLSLTNIMGSLEFTEDIDFVEHVAKLTNVLGVELCKIWEGADTETKTVAYNQIELLLPFLLKFLANEYDDVSCAVFSFVSALLTFFKKQKKQVGSLTGPQLEFLDSLLKVIVIKMKYDDETDWEGAEDEEMEEAEFLEMRKNLKAFFDAIFNIDESLFTSYVHTAVVNTLEKYQMVENSVDWRELELALHVLLLYGEAFKGPLVFVMKHNNEIVAFTPLGQMVSRMIQCNVSTFQHPAIPLIFFENVVRYYQFFEVQPDCIPSILEAFVDSRGLHNSILQIRTRSWYLFYRFVKLLKSRMGPYVENVLTSIQDLLVVQADLSSVDASEGAITRDQAMEGGFDDQIYLFETVGTLITVESIPADRQTEFAKIVISPLLADIERNLTTELSEPKDLNVLQLHHLIMAVGSIGKGFPEAPKNEAPNAQWVVLLKQSTEAILVVLKALSRFEIIRDAARFAFARLVNILGVEVLPYLPELITGLLNECQVSELLDSLPFIGLLSYKFNPSIYDILNELIGPLIIKVFFVLNQTPSGTDEAVLLLNLRKAYLSFILSLLNGGMDAVFVSDLNQPRLENILQSVVHYASDLVDLPSARTAFSILLKTVTLWGSPIQTSTNNVDSGRSLPGFEQFMYEHILRICFEVPMKPAFNITDGQSVLVLNEIPGIIRTMYSQRGHELIDYLRRVWLPQNLADEFVQALQQLDQKGFKTYFRTFVQRSKS
ncbi:11366_t:CDS:10 [Funneliformis mosseae]|uniref:Exportin-T n=1 Tax=Funneliformis mosseae TaxID=27381 RepID=A0A9N9BP29_FUNMO|nr:11366_t:CDS:10 [Funneliformis mosseae]